MQPAGAIIKKLRLFDIAANLSDKRFQGIYNGKKQHDPDLEVVLERAKKYGVEKMLFASGYLKDAERSYNLSLLGDDFYCTAGVHPCRAGEPKKIGVSVHEYLDRICALIDKMDRKDKLIAIGECGLDYDRFTYADKETQHEVFPPHFDIANKYHLPMYLHSRSTNGDFARIVKENRSKFTTGVVHSYTGDEVELKELLAMGLYIGVNGCSLKTEENIKICKMIPLDRIMLETDAPYCDIRNSHASAGMVKTKFAKCNKEKYTKDKLVKDRNEPCTIVQVLEVVAALHGVKEEELADIAWHNTLKMFNLDKGEDHIPSNSS